MISNKFLNKAISLVHLVFFHNIHSVIHSFTQMFIDSHIQPLLWFLYHKVGLRSCIFLLILWLYNHAAQAQMKERRARFLLWTISVGMNFQKELLKVLSKCLQNHLFTEIQSSYCLNHSNSFKTVFECISVMQISFGKKTFSSTINCTM